MKPSWLFAHVLFLVVVLWGQNIYAQDHTRWHLPEGAFLRLGKGWILGGDRAVAYSPDGQMLAVASIIGIWIYDAHTGTELNFFGGSKELGIGPLAFSPDETTLAGGGFWEDKVWLWDVATGQLKATFEGRSVYVRSLAFSPDGATLAVTSHDLATDTVRVWDVASRGQTVTMAPPFPVLSLAFSSDGATIALGGYGQGESKAKTLQLWDVTSGQQKTSLGGSETVNSVAFSPDGASVVGAGSYSGSYGVSSGRIRDWNVASGQIRAAIRPEVRCA